MKRKRDENVIGRSIYPNNRTKLQNKHPLGILLFPQPTKVVSSYAKAVGSEQDENKSEEDVTGCSMSPNKCTKL